MTGVGSGSSDPLLKSRVAPNNTKNPLMRQKPRPGQLKKDNKPTDSSTSLSESCGFYTDQSNFE